jgi:hypothetical protein
MQWALVAVALGVAVGYATGGRIQNLSAHSVRALPLLAVGAGLPLFGRDNATVLVLSLLALFAFALANLQLVGMGVVAVGLALNAVVITANGAMPVRPAAAERVGVDVDELGGGRRLESPGDRFTALADVLPARPLRQVLSFGDLVIAAGMVDVIARLMRRRRARSTGVVRENAGRRAGRLPPLWSKTRKPSPCPRSAPAEVVATTPVSSAASSAVTSAPSRPAGRAGVSGARSRGSARDS